MKLLRLDYGSHCWVCGARIKYLNSYIGSIPFRFYCEGHKEHASGEVRKVIGRADTGPITRGLDHDER